MAESKVRNESYYQVSGWMLNRLQLKGIELDVFAIIYGFSQDGESSFTGSLQYLSDFTNATRPTVIKALKSLVEKGYVVKHESQVNGVKFNTYKTNLQVVKNLYWGSKETLPGGSKESLPNNKAFDNKVSDRKGIDYQRIADMYNETCVSFPRCVGLSETRKKAIRARFKSGYTLEDFKTLFTKAEASSFLKGKNNRNWAANFDWLIKDANMAKVLEGNYDEKRPGRQEPVPSWMQQGGGDNDLCKRLMEKMRAEEAGQSPELAERAAALKEKLGQKI